MPPLTEDFHSAGQFNCMLDYKVSKGVSSDGVSRYTNVTYNELSTLTYTSQDRISYERLDQIIVNGSPVDFLINYSL